MDKPVLRAAERRDRVPLLLAPGCHGSPRHRVLLRLLAGAQVPWHVVGADRGILLRPERGRAVEARAVPGGTPFSGLLSGTGACGAGDEPMRVGSRARGRGHPVRPRAPRVLPSAGSQGRAHVPVHSVALHRARTRLLSRRQYTPAPDRTAGDPRGAASPATDDDPGGGQGRYPETSGCSRRQGALHSLPASIGLSYYAHMCSK